LVNVAIINICLPLGIFNVALVEKPDRIRLPLTAEETKQFGCGYKLWSTGNYTDHKDNIFFKFVNIGGLQCR
jgi:hypothetical protein